jgi:hypothetical protein
MIPLETQLAQAGLALTGASVKLSTYGPPLAA